MSLAVSSPAATTEAAMSHKAAPLLAIRARTIMPLTGESPARGTRLFAPLKKIDDAVLLVRDGLIEDVCPWQEARLPAGTQVRDVGPVCLAPATINAHCHIQLSWLQGHTLWGKGFTAWLSSMIPQLHSCDTQKIHLAMEDACESIAASGTLHVGDVGGSLQGSLPIIHQACRTAGLGITHFCEWFGFGPPFVDNNGPWPPRCRDEILQDADLAASCVPCGHALYSTGADVLRSAKQYSLLHDGVFSFHLAESPEETELLTDGRGPLYQCYAGSVLPDGWRPPGLRPLAYAAGLGLLGSGSLAVHGVQLDAQEIGLLAASGTALCLCPYSNHNLAVGAAPVQALLESGTLLCLGTDGLTSNTSLDVRREAVFLRESLDVPPEALIRMLTINGAAALGLPSPTGTLAPGSPARFCILPEPLTY